LDIRVLITVETTSPSTKKGKKYSSANSDYKKVIKLMLLSLRITRLGIQPALKVDKVVVLLLLMKKLLQFILVVEGRNQTSILGD
jgi:hypothetical protein